MTNLADNALAAKRVGQYLIDAGVLTAAQLDEALERQRRMSKAGFHVLLGTILEEMGAIDRQSLEAIILRQRLDEGTVNLGPEIDWSRFRAGTSNGTPESAPETPSASPLTPQHAAEAIDAFFGQTETAPEASQAWPAAPAGPASFVPMNSSSSVEEAAPSSGHDWTVAQTAEAVAPAAESEASPEPSRSWLEESLPKFPFFGRRGASTEEPEAAVQDDGGSEPAADSSAAPVGDTHVASAPSWPAAESVHTDPVTPVAAVSPVAPTAPSEVKAEAKAEHETPATVTAEAAPPTPTTAAEHDSEVAPEPAQEAAGPVDLHGFKFSRSSAGVTESEVNAVIGQLIRRNKTLEEQMGEAKEMLSHLDSMRRYGEQSVKAADTIAQQIREEAEDQAGAIRERAQQEARKIVADARGRHDEIVRAAGEKAMAVAQEIERELEEQRARFDAFKARAQALVETDTSTDE